MPKQERDAIEQKQEIFDFMAQSHVSPKNVVRLGELNKSENRQVAELAAIVLEVARVKPFKTKRLKFIARQHPELLEKLKTSGLILAHGY
jgi:hypothetical protein